NFMEYGEHVRLYEVELAVMMCDHHMGEDSGQSLFAGQGHTRYPSKRLQKAVDRNAKWMLKQTEPDQEDSDRASGRGMFYTVVGGQQWSLRKQAIDKLAERVNSSEQYAQCVHGIILDDFGSVPLRDRFKLLRQCVELINS